MALDTLRRSLLKFAEEQPVQVKVQEQKSTKAQRLSETARKGLRTYVTTQKKEKREYDKDKVEELTSSFEKLTWDDVAHIFKDKERYRQFLRTDKGKEFMTSVQKGEHPVSALERIFSSKFLGLTPKQWAEAGIVGGTGIITGGILGYLRKKGKIGRGWLLLPVATGVGTALATELMHKDSLPEDRMKRILVKSLGHIGLSGLSYFITQSLTRK